MALGLGAAGVRNGGRPGDVLLQNRLEKIGQCPVFSLRAMPCGLEEADVDPYGDWVLHHVRQG
jgi:hypothetical protein